MGLIRRETWWKHLVFSFLILIFERGNIMNGVIYKEFIDRGLKAQELKKLVDELHDPIRFGGFNKRVKYMRAVADKVITMEVFKRILEFYDI